MKVTDLEKTDMQLRMDKAAILATLGIQDIGRKQTNITKTNLIKSLLIVAIHLKLLQILFYSFRPAHWFSF